MNTKLDIVRFECDDVVATSGNPDTLYKHHYKVTAIEEQNGVIITGGDFYAYVNGSWYEQTYTLGNGPSGEFFIGTTPELNKWYYATGVGGSLTNCDHTNHVYITDNLINPD